MKEIPFYSLSSYHNSIKTDLNEAMQRVLESGNFILGNEVAKFEQSFASLCGTKHCIGVANGLDALKLALIAGGVGSGDEVIVPAFTFVATWLAVTSIGAVVVPVDVDYDTRNIDPGNAERAITGKTKAIIPVHLYGLPAPVDKLNGIASSRNILVLEDAAQAHGAAVGGRPTGSLGGAAAFSFYPTKNLGALGDGGAVVTSDDEFASRLRRLRNYGQSQKYVCTELGVNSRLDEIQAAVLSAKLVSFQKLQEHRAQVATTYLLHLAGKVDGEMLQVPQVPQTLQHGWHLFAIATPRREGLQKFLLSRGIHTQIHYPVAPHQQVCFRQFDVARHKLPNTERLTSEVLSLPLGPHVSTDDARAIACLTIDYLRKTA